MPTSSYRRLNGKPLKHPVLDRTHYYSMVSDIVDRYSIKAWARSTKLVEEVVTNYRLHHTVS